jgi:hypothetical protein
LKSVNVQQPATSAYYNVHEELAGKYGKTHVFRVKTLEEFDQKVINNKYPVVVLYSKE